MEQFLSMFGSVTISQVVVVIMATLWIFEKIKKLLKLYSKRHDEEQEIDETLSKVKNYEQDLQNLNKNISQLQENYQSISQKHTEMSKSIEQLIQCQEDNRKVSSLQVRHNIVRACNDAIQLQEISSSELKSLEELYQMYTEVLHMNSYVTTLMKAVRKLPIVEYHTKTSR